MSQSYFRQDYLRTPEGARVFFQVYGEGRPAVVLCDGLGCDGFAWRYLLPQLHRRHRVVRWHYRGHGQSTLPRERNQLGMSYNCEDLQRVLDAIDLDTAIIFGHSMGVQVALEFHRRHPARVSALGLICGSYGNPLDTVHDGPTLKRLFPVLRGIAHHFPNALAKFCRFALRTELALQLTLSLELNRSLLRRSDILPYFHHLADMDPGVFVQTLDSLAEHTAWDHLTRIQVPTLIIAGERDRFTPMWLSRRMAENIPNAEFRILPQGSHTTPLEHPELVWAYVERFLSSLSPKSSSEARVSPTFAAELGRPH